MGSAPKPPPPSAEELAMTRRQRIRLDEEIAQNEARLKQQARGRLGKKSLLKTPISMATGSGAQAGDITEGFIKTKSGRMISEKALGRMGRTALRNGRKR
jgi:hypothetical protein